jgi:signal transduction histidine kinase
MDSPVLRLETSIDNGNAILLVEDNGQGIEPSHQSRIFDAFFTTKADMGTGIGLWVTRELVEKNRGTITVESGDLDHGMRTRFRVCFPLASTKTADSLTTPALLTPDPTSAPDSTSSSASSSITTSLN